MIYEICRLAPIVTFFLWIIGHCFFKAKLFEVQKAILDKITPKSLDDNKRIVFLGGCTWLVFVFLWLNLIFLFSY